MNKPLLLVLMLALIGTAIGCQGLTPPNWFHPGPAPYQQQQAVRFDPYPESEPAPEIVGARPLGYENPVPEVQRARWFTQPGYPSVGR